MRLDKNELPWDWPFIFKCKVLLKTLKAEWNRYPPFSLGDLERRLGEKVGVGHENILIINGSTSGIDFFYNQLYRVQWGYIQGYPSYFKYTLIAHFFRKRPYYSELDDEGGDNGETIADLCRQYPYLPVILCIPNNPTGAILSEEEIIKIANSSQNKVLLDLTYVRFQDRFGDFNFSNYLSFPNIIQLHSLSKSFGCAGIRIGFLIVPSAMKKELMEAWNPFPLNNFSYAFLEEVLKPLWWRYGLSRIKKIKENRDKLFGSLKHLQSIRVLPTQANFITIECIRNYKRVFASLKDEGVQVKALGKNYLRITVGNWRQCALVVKVLKIIDSECELPLSSLH